MLDTIVGFHLHRGILALACGWEAATGRRRSPDCRSLAGRRRLRPFQPRQYGRHVSQRRSLHGGRGVSGLHLLRSALYRKALRVSVGSVLSVPYHRSGDALSMLEALANEGFEIWSLSPAGKTEIRHIPPSPRMALVIGTEGEGLPPAVLSRFHSARIAQSPQLDSLNAGTASGLALYQMASPWAVSERLTRP